MSQSTRIRVAAKVQSLRESDVVPFREILDDRKVDHALAEEGATFSRRIYTPAMTLWVFLAQVLDPDHSCRAAVARLMAWRVADGQKPCSADTGGYCDARRRLPLGVVRRLVRQVAEEVEGRAPERWLWKGRPVAMVDGSTASMPDTAANQARYPQAPSQPAGLGFPIVRIVALISLATGLVRDLAIGPYEGKETGETALFRTLWERLRAGEIVLGDRCFASFLGIAGLADRGVDVLFRMHQRRKHDFRRGRRIAATDHVVFWTKPERPDWMDEATYARMPARMEMRELKVTVDQPGFRVHELVLVTTMCDGAAYTKQELAELYLDRWNVELDLRAIKCVLQMEILRCKSPAMVEKEIWMHALAYDLIRGLTAEAARSHDRRPRDLSFKGTLQTMTAFQDVLRRATAEERPALMETLLAAIAHHRVGDRFGRIEPRANKRRPRQQRYLKEPRAEARNRLMGNV